MQIAEPLPVSPFTTKTHLGAIQNKRGVSSRVHIAVKNGPCPPILGTGLKCRPASLRSFSVWEIFIRLCCYLLRGAKLSQGN
ncbi:hypothetical protein [Actinobaculum suis]|uniref:hypothetical protein n=1 Tax=Actinobaculum suis TaxID=1657 RepID=UPI001C8E38CA